MFITINTIKSYMDICNCMTADKIREATLQNEHLSALTELVLHNWSSTKTEVQKELKPYWSFIDKIAIIDGISIKEGRKNMPISAQKRQ